MDPEKKIYQVVINAGEQYSLWPADRQNSPGWNALSF
jgi:uncharacterized protein YbdZ (MbtH family)